MLEAAMVSGAIELASRAGKAAADGAVKTGKAVGGVLAGQSLVGLSNVARVEPLTLVDADVVNLDYIDGVMQSVQAVFSGYYLQAVNMVNTIGGISVAERLAPLNPGHGHGFESFQEPRRFGLSKKSRALALEAEQVQPKADGKKPEGDDAKLEKAPKRSTGVNTSDYDSVQNAANLSVGKLFNVKMKVNQDEISMPVAIRLMVNVLPTSILTELFTYRDAFDMNMKERWYMYKAGNLGFFRDLILCQDLIAKRRRMAITDKSGVGAKILNREAAIVFRALKGHESYSTASNIAIISEDTLGQVENKIGGRLSNSKVRRTIFENTNLMLLVIINKHYERVTIYTRDVDASTTLSVSQMKSASKGSGPEVVDIMKAYMMGSSPQSL